MNSVSYSIMKFYAWMNLLLTFLSWVKLVVTTMVAAVRYHIHPAHYLVHTH